MSSLKELNLSQYEQAIYLALIKLQKADARKISQESKVPPTAVYPNLKSLVEKGLIQKMNSENSIYEIINPEIGLKSYVEKRKRNLDLSLSSTLEQIKQMPKNLIENKERVNISLGNEFSQNMFYDLSQKTLKTIYIMGWKFNDKKNDKFKLLKALKKLKDDKKDVRLLTNDTDAKNNKIIKEIRKFGIPIKHHPLQNTSIIIRDAQETKITLKNKDLGDKISLYIDDMDLSKAMNEYFLTCWKKAKLI